MSESNRAKTLAAPLTVVAAADTRFHELWPTHRAAPRHGGAAARGRPRGARAPRDASAARWLTAYFLIGVRAAGLAAGPMGGFDRAGVDGEFFADGRWRSILVVNVGGAAADGHGERRPRLAFADAARVV